MGGLNVPGWVKFNPPLTLSDFCSLTECSVLKGDFCILSANSSTLLSRELDRALAAANSTFSNQMEHHVAQARRMEQQQQQQQQHQQQPRRGDLVRAIENAVYRLLPGSEHASLLQPLVRLLAAAPDEEEAQAMEQLRSQIMALMDSAPPVAVGEILQLLMTRLDNLYELRDQFSQVQQQRMGSELVQQIVGHMRSESSHILGQMGHMVGQVGQMMGNHTSTLLAFVRPIMERGGAQAGAGPWQLQLPPPRLPLEGKMRLVKERAKTLQRREQLLANVNLQIMPEQVQRDGGGRCDKGLVWINFGFPIDKSPTLTPICCCLTGGEPWGGGGAGVGGWPLRVAGLHHQQGCNAGWAAGGRAPLPHREALAHPNDACHGGSPLSCAVGGK